MKRTFHPALAALFLLFFTLGMSSPVQDGFGEGSTAPEFEITADDGNTYTIGSLTENAPAFIVFWKESCPSNRRAAPLFKAIKDAYGEKANLIGVVTAPPERISDWAEQFETNYPLLPNSDKSLIRDYDLSRSITTYQIGTNGKITTIFAGFGYDALSSLNKAMAEAAGVDVAEVDLSSAPTRTTYG